MLAFVQDGLHNAEIAVRLGVSVNTVRYHVTNLLAKAGVSERGALRGWDGSGAPREGRRALAWLTLLAKPWLLAAAGVAVAGTIAGATALWLTGVGEAPAQPLPPGMRTLTAEDLEREGFEDAGVLLESLSGGDPVLGGELRDTFSVVALTGDARVLYNGAYRWGTGVGVVLGSVGVVLSGELGSVRFQVNLGTNPEELDSVINKPVTGGVTIRGARAGAPPRLTVEAARTSDRASFRAVIDSRGHLFLSREPVPADGVYDEWTGMQLDVSGALPAGSLPAGYMRFTGCGEGSCYVSHRTITPLLAPVAGTLSCASPTRMDLDAGQFVLHIKWVDTAYGGPPGLSCAPHQVAVGDEIGPVSHWVFTATSADTGEPLSVGVGGDGRLYVGKFAPTVGCPCRSGS